LQFDQLQQQITVVHNPMKLYTYIKWKSTKMIPISNTIGKNKFNQLQQQISVYKFDVNFMLTNTKLKKKIMININIATTKN